MAPDSLFLLADATDVLSGGGGWAGAGLLGLVLAWLLLKHLPDKDRQLKELIDSKDAAIDALIEKQDARIGSLQATFKASIDAVVKHCEDEGKATTAAFQKEIGRVADLLAARGQKG